MKYMKGLAVGVLWCPADHLQDGHGVFLLHIGGMGLSRLAPSSLESEWRQTDRHWERKGRYRFSVFSLALQGCVSTASF